jgi:hypothetical protein
VNLRPHQRRLPVAVHLARLEAAIAGANGSEPTPAELRTLRAVCAAAWQAFRGEVWTVSHLVDVGAIEPHESRSLGRVLARRAGYRTDGLELVAAGESREGLRWRLRVSR